MVFNIEFIRDAIYYEAERGGQVFFIHNRVQGLPEMAVMIQGLCPDLSIAYAHGQMEGDQLEEMILDFIDQKYDVLVCTNIVESGVDIPNANTIIVNNAHHFGLSDLHQLRGRVGRSNKKAFCYLLAPPMSTLPTIAASVCKPWNSSASWAAASRLPCATWIYVAPAICWVVSKAALLPK